MSAERYFASIAYGGVVMDPDADGDYVLSEDYDLLVARVAELEAELAKREAVAEGFVLVPKEPTPAMLRAGYEAHVRHGMESVREVWESMLAAKGEGK